MPKHFTPQDSSFKSLHLWVLHHLGVPKMKNQASAFLKHVFSAVVAIVKAKSMAAKSKAGAMKTRLLIFGLLRNKKVLMSAISHKIHALMGKEKNGGEESPAATEDYSKAVVLYNVVRHEATPHTVVEEEDEYPDLTHSLFDLDEEEEEDDGLGNGTGSVIDLVRNSREEEGSEFKLEDEIDHVADVFIRRFHKEMRMQKQQSFKRYREMLERSV